MSADEVPAMIPNSSFLMVKVIFVDSPGPRHILLAVATMMATARKSKAGFLIYGITRNAAAKVRMA